MLADPSRDASASSTLMIRNHSKNQSSPAPRQANVDTQFLVAVTRWHRKRGQPVRQGFPVVWARNCFTDRRADHFSGPIGLGLSAASNADYAAPANSGAA
jgi:hypothetical protein